jgi:hypothetical protein
VAITSRILGDLRELRWGQVVVELALLVAGILIALAVNGWIEDRRDARVEREYLELLVRDLDRDVAVLQEVIEFETAQVTAAAQAYRAIRGGVAPEDREAVAKMLGQLTARRTLRLSRATYSDLLSTGNLRLIRNGGLRDSIVRLYETNERLQSIRDRNNQEFVDRLYVTYLLDHAWTAPRATRNLPAISSSDRKFAARVAVPVDAKLDLLWRLPADAPDWAVLASRLWYRGLVSEGAIEQSGNSAVEIAAVRQAIVDELARRRWP